MSLHREFFHTDRNAPSSFHWPGWAIHNQEARVPGMWCQLKRGLEYSSSLYCRGSPYVKAIVMCWPHVKTMKCIFKMVCYVTIGACMYSTNLPIQIQRCEKHAKESLRVWLQCASAKGTALIMDHPVPFCRQTIIRWPKKENRTKQALTHHWETAALTFQHPVQQFAVAQLTNHERDISSIYSLIAD